MTQVLVVVLGQPGPDLQEATGRGGPLEASEHLAVLRLPPEEDAVAAMGLPGAFRLAWIFTDASLLDSAALRACHRRLAPIAPVTIAVREDPAASIGSRSAGDFPGGVILQPYTDASFLQVSALIAGFSAKAAPCPEEEEKH